MKDNFISLKGKVPGQAISFSRLLEEEDEEAKLREVRPGVLALLWALDPSLKVVLSLNMEGWSLCPGQGQAGRRA